VEKTPKQKIMKDREVNTLIKKEIERERKVVNLIASENFVSADVLCALGSVFTNKYAEGYPGKRYYGGSEVVDALERLTQSRALTLFGLSAKKWHVNVQPLSGSPANLAVFTALVPHDGTGKIMGMSLAHGGHLTHGHAVSATGKFWKQVPYGVSATNERLDYDELARIAKKERPHIIVAGFTAYSRKIDWKKFRYIADTVGAYLLVDMSHISGLVAGGVHASPFPYADIVTTTTHKTLRGPRGAMIFVRKDARKLDEKIDKAVFPGLQGGPHENAIAGIAVALKEAMDSKFKSYAKQVVTNAAVLADELTRLDWRIVSGGTDNHLLLVDTWKNGVSGKEASLKLEAAGIIVNMNTIPFDTRTPMDPSGIRIGTPAETTRGKKEKDMILLAQTIDTVLRKKVRTK
jgi:glycine hydroxymethyltransferase